MSFGKNSALLGRVGSFRQQGERLGKRPPRSGGGNWGGAVFRDRYKPSLIAPDMGRIIAAKYEIELANEDGQVETIEMPNYKTTEHYYKRTKRTGYCSGGPLAHLKGKREPCLGCDAFWAGAGTDANGKWKKGPMGKSDTYVFNFLHYTHYHEVEQTDGSGAIRTGPQGTPYMEWVPCDKTYNLPCQGCQTGRKTELGRLLHWPMGFSHYKTLLSVEDQIGRSCASCSSVNSISTLAWLCRNPECGEAVIDLASTHHKPEDIRKLTLNKAQCPRCRYVGYLDAYYECGKCSKPKQATLFDIDIQVMRVEQGSGDSKQTNLQISQWSEPRAIDERFQAKAAKPLQLNKIYAPTPLDEQAKLFGMPMPGGVSQPQRQPVTPDEAARPYGQGETPPVDIYKP